MCAKDLPEHGLEAVFWRNPSFETVDQYVVRNGRVRNPT